MADAKRWDRSLDRRLTDGAGDAFSNANPSYQIDYYLRITGRDWGLLTKQFTGKGIHVEEGHFSRVEWQPQPHGKQPKMVEIPGSEFTLRVDLVLLAMGFLHVRHNRLLEDIEVAFDRYGNIAYDDQYTTSAPGVFVAGDAGLGASLVVRSIFQGREAAKAIDDYLKQ